MNYPTIFSAIPWENVGVSVVQTTTIFIFILLGLKLVGRRVFGERSPQDLITLLLIAESCSNGLVDQNAGYWGAVFSAMTILVLGYLCDRLGLLDHILNPDPIVLFKDGELRKGVMKENMVEERDLDEMAREYGVASFRDFNAIMLESGGGLTGILCKEKRTLD